MHSSAALAHDLFFFFFFLASKSFQAFFFDLCLQLRLNSYILKKNDSLTFNGHNDLRFVNLLLSLPLSNETNPLHVAYPSLSALNGKCFYATQLVLVHFDDWN